MLNLLEYEYRDIEKVLEPVSESSIDEIVGLSGGEFPEKIIMGFEIIRPDRYHLQAALERVSEILDRARARAIIKQFRDNPPKEAPASCDSSSA